MKPIYRILLVIFVAHVLLVFGCANQKANLAEDSLQGTTPGTMDSPDYLTGSGEHMLATGNVEQAEKFFSQALSIDDTHVDAMIGMSDVALIRNDTEKAIEWAELGIKNAETDPDRRDAITALMNIYGTTHPDDWLEEMEDLWEDVREIDTQPEQAALIMGKGYQETGDYLNAVVCYREVLEWDGAFAGEADQAMESLFRQLRAEPGSPVGRTVSRLETINRGDLCALIIEELKLPEYLDKKIPKKYNASFVTPQKYSEDTKKEPLPEDVSDSRYEANIIQVLNYEIRGLEPFPDGGFYPEAPVTRSAFALSVEDILSRIKDEPLLTTAFVGSSSPFPDVPEDHFAFNAIVVSTTRDFLAADLDGAFRPDEPVSGAESLIGIRKLKEEIKGKQVRY